MPKLAALLMITAPAFAGEYAVLATGFRIPAERHEIAGSIVRLIAKNGVTELPASAIERFEADDYVAPAAAPVPPRVDAALPTWDSRTLLQEAAVRTGLPATLVESVARVESGFRQDAVSSKGALGVMQLMPGTAKALAADPRDPVQNIDAGARLLRELLLKYDGDVVKALSAYNAGPGAVARYRGMPPFAETQNYVDKVIRAYVKAGGR